VICLNGAAARLMNPGELIIILAYAVLTEDELKGFKPRIVFVDENNRPFQTQSLQEEIQNKA